MEFTSLAKIFNELGVAGFSLVALVFIAFFAVKGFLKLLEKNNEVYINTIAEYKAIAERANCQADKKDELMQMQMKQSDKIVSSIDMLTKNQDFFFKRVKSEHEQIIGVLKSCRVKKQIITRGETVQ